METLILKSNTEKKVDLSTKWKEEILQYFSEDLHFSDKNQGEDDTLSDEIKWESEDKVCPYCGNRVPAIDIKKHPISGKICKECLNSIVSNKIAVMELVNDCIYSLDCFFGLKLDKRIAVTAKNPFFHFSKNNSAGFTDKPINIKYKKKGRWEPDSLTITLGFPEDIVRRELLQVLIIIGLHARDENNKHNEFRNGMIQWMTVHCLYLDFHQDFAAYCDEIWGKSDDGTEYQECCDKFGSPLTETLISLEQLGQQEQKERQE